MKNVRKRIVVSCVLIVSLVALASSLIVSVFSVPDDLDFTYVTIYTHNHIATSYMEARRINEERDQQILDDSIADFYSAYHLMPLQPPTAKYNCHSYAWYNQSASNNIWVDDISTFLSDATQVSSSMVQPGDIVVYAVGLPDGTYGVVHSALVESVSNGNIVLVSKWGEGGVYRHPVNANHPYTTDYQGNTTQKFYFRIECKYNHTYSDISSSKHRAYCWCGASQLQSHSMSQSGNHLVCTKCGHTTELWSVEPVEE